MELEDGTAAQVGYTYTLDQLTAIAHNGFTYGFAYDPYGSIRTVTAAGTALITHNYEAGNGNLLSNVYGNGDTIRYVYDDQDRVSEVHAKTASGTEKQLFTYVYNKEGYLYQVTDHVLGRSAVFAYDLLGRLAQVDNSDGSWYRYTYDVNGNVEKVKAGAANGEAYDMDYTYDKDNRETEAKLFTFPRATAYDAYGRITSRTWRAGTTGEYNIFRRCPPLQARRALSGG